VGDKKGCGKKGKKGEGEEEAKENVVTVFEPFLLLCLFLDRHFERNRNSVREKKVRGERRERREKTERPDPLWALSSFVVLVCFVKK
jgi:hypothetical protein